jgi:hypothetical protein
MTSEKFFPNEANLGHNCMYWDVGPVAMACAYPKAEMIGRRSCEGTVDDVCLFLRIGRQQSSLTEPQIAEIKLRAPDLYDKSYLPPGDIV